MAARTAFCDESIRRYRTADPVYLLAAYITDQDDHDLIDALSRFRPHGKLHWHDAKPNDKDKICKIIAAHPSEHLIVAVTRRSTACARNAHANAPSRPCSYCSNRTTTSPSWSSNAENATRTRLIAHRSMHFVAQARSRLTLHSPTSSVPVSHGYGCRTRSSAPSATRGLAHRRHGASSATRCE